MACQKAEKHSFIIIQVSIDQFMLYFSSLFFVSRQNRRQIASQSALAMLAGLAIAAPPPAFALPLDSPAAAIGQWDLTLLGSNQKCRVTLRDPGQPDLQVRHQNIRIPVACRETIPVLETVDDWTVRDGQHLELLNIGGEVVLDFIPKEGRVFATTGPSGESYEFIAITAPAAHIAYAAPGQVANNSAVPAGQALTSAALANSAAARSMMAHAAAASPLNQPQPQASAAQPIIEAKTVAAAKIPAASIKPGEVPGRYAILRDGGRDTGCMLTLDSTKGTEGNKAMLAPACRDQGIVIFDPVGWQIVKGQLVLFARKGHSTHLDLAADGTFSKDAKEGKPLGLKRL